MAISNEQLASAMQTLLDKWLARERQQLDRENGTATGGPNGDGYYPVTDATGTTTMQPSPAKLALLAATPKIIELTGAGPFTLTLAQAGNRVRIGNGTTTTPIIVNIPVAPVGTVWFIRQRASSPLKFVPPSGVNLRHRLGATSTAGQYASAAVCYEASDQVFLDGDVA